MTMKIFGLLNPVKNSYITNLRYFRTTTCRLQHLAWSPNAKMNKMVFDKYMCLPLPDCKCQVNYVWIDGTGQRLRSKSRVLDFIPAFPGECPKWTFDGSNTGQAEGEDTDVYLIPVALYKDPFRRGKNKMVLCETYNQNGTPAKANQRACLKEALKKVTIFEPQFGFEQEYQLMDMDKRPFGWPIMRGEPVQGKFYYCGVGAHRAYGRDVAEAHFRASLYSGVQIFGINAEATPGQWEFQTGPSDAMKSADDTWMGRYILERIAEEFGLSISFHPQLFDQWNGAGLHANFSTAQMRQDNGMPAILEAIEKLSKRHDEHIARYDPKQGEYNKLRLTGLGESSRIDEFTNGIGTRHTSVRISRMVADKKGGYLEDRRPASNADPYAVCDAIVRTVLLDC